MIRIGLERATNYADVFWKKWKLTINIATTKRFVLKKGGSKSRENEKLTL